MSPPLFSSKNCNIYKDLSISLGEKQNNDCTVNAKEPKSIHPGLCAIVMDSDGLVLLPRCSTMMYNNAWAFPMCGLETGDSMEDGVKKVLNDFLRIELQTI